jgi:hypothetical protein
MTDEELVKRLRKRQEFESIDGYKWIEWKDEDALEAADRIEALTVERDDFADQIANFLPAVNREAVEQRARAEAAEAKLAKAVRGLNAIGVWGEDTYARDMARTTLAEIDAEIKRSKMDISKGEDDAATVE